MLCIGLLFTVPLVYAGDLPRHLDPAEMGEENPFPSKLFLLYQLLFHSISLEDYTGASDWLAWALEVYAPPQTRFVLTRFNELLGYEIQDLNLTDTNIDEALELLKWLRANEADQALEQALLHLAEANVTVGMLEDAAVQLGSTLRAPPTSLLEGTDAVRLLIEKYLSLIRELREEVVLIEQNPLIDTSLYIEADKSEVFVGKSVNISGSLTTFNGTGLKSRTVDLLLNGARVGKYITNMKGKFSEAVTIPFLYRDSVLFSAVYLPKGADQDVYTPSASNRLVLSLLYYSPVVTVEGPGQVYPGTEASVYGSLTFNGEPLPDFKIMITGFHSMIEAISGVDGGFSVDLAIPADAPSGYATVRVEALPNEVYGPASAELGLQVVRLPTELRVKAPSWIFSGGKIKVEGRVTVEDEPLRGCGIALKIGEEVVSTKSLEDGSFEARMDLPLAMFTSRHTYWITASPVEPWIEPSTVSRGIFVVNVFTLVGGPVFLGVALVYAAKRIEWRPRRKREENEAESEVDEPVLEAEAPVEAKVESFEEIYRRAVELVSRITGSIMLPSQTIREYLGAVREDLGELGYGVFKSLSLLYEDWLYGIPLEPDLGAAQRLLNEIAELLTVEG